MNEQLQNVWKAIEVALLSSEGVHTPIKSVLGYLTDADRKRVAEAAFDAAQDEISAVNWKT